MPKPSANKNKKILSSQNENYFFCDQIIKLIYGHKFDFFKLENGKSEKWTFINVQNRKFKKTFPTKISTF